jgi:hypothetical protein
VVGERLDVRNSQEVHVKKLHTFVVPQDIALETVLVLLRRIIVRHGSNLARLAR